MSVYTLIIGMLIVGSVFYDGLVANRSSIEFIRREKYGYKLFFILSCITIILVAGFRGQMATDMVSYEKEFNIIGKMSWKEIFSVGFRLNGGNSTEIGFIIINKIISMFTKNSTVFFTLMSIGSFGPLFYYIKNRSEMPFLSLLIFFSVGYFFHSFNVVRSCFVAGLYCLAIDDIAEKKFRAYAIKVLLLTTVHTAAIIMLPAYFINRGLILRSKKSIVIVIGILIVVFNLNRIFGLLDNILFNSFYTTIYDGVSLEKVTISSLLPSLFVFGVLLLFINFFDADSPHDVVVVNGSFLWCCFGIMRLSMGFFSRFQDITCVYLTLFIPLLLYRAVEKQDDPKTRLIVKLLMICLIVILLTLLISRILADTPYNPYYTAWSK